VVDSPGEQVPDGDKGEVEGHEGGAHAGGRGGARMLAARAASPMDATAVTPSGTASAGADENWHSSTRVLLLVHTDSS